METTIASVDAGDPDQVRTELNRQWRLARTDFNTRQILAAMEIDLEALDAIDANPLSAEPGGRGNRADVGTMILIGIAVKVGSDLGSKALQTLWEKVIKGEIEKRFGKTRPAPADQHLPGN